MKHPALICICLACLMLTCLLASHTWQQVAREQLRRIKHETTQGAEVSNEDLMFGMHATLSLQFPDLVFLVHVADNSSSLAVAWSPESQADQLTAIEVWLDGGSKVLVIYAAMAPACGERGALKASAAWVLAGAASAAADWANNSSGILEYAAGYMLENSPAVGLNLDLVLVTEGALVVHSFNVRCLYQRSLPQMTGGWHLFTVIGTNVD